MTLAGALAAWTGSRFLVPTEDAVRMLLDDGDVAATPWFFVVERVLGLQQRWWCEANVEIDLPERVQRPDVLRAFFSVKWFRKVVEVLRRQLSSLEAAVEREGEAGIEAPPIAGDELVSRTLLVGKELCGISSGMVRLLQQSCSRSSQRFQRDLSSPKRRKRIRTLGAEQEECESKRPCHRVDDVIFVAPPMKPSAANLTRVVVQGRATSEADSDGSTVFSSGSLSPVSLDSASSSGSDVTVLAPPSLLLSLDVSTGRPEA